MQIEQLQVDVHVDIRKNNTQSLGVTLMSRDINNYQFYLRVLQDGELLVMDDSYEVEVLSLFTTSKSKLLTKGTIKSHYVDWQFDPSYISKSEVVKNYVYVRKDGELLISADANCFIFEVGLSAIDKDTGRVAEVYDENYENVLADYSGALDDRTTERLDEAVLDFNQRGDAEIADWRVDADVELEEYLADKFVLKNIVENGDFSDGVTGWIGTFGISTVDLSVANKILSAPIINNSLMGGVRQNTDTTYNAGDKIYQKVRYRVTNDDCLSIRFSNGGTVSGGATDIVHRSVSENVWYEQSHLHTLGTGSGYLFLQILHYYVDTATAKNKVLETDYIMGINLTQTFGAGNEPSKEWMDRLIEQTGYFDEHILDEDWQVGEILRLDDIKANKVQEDWITPTLLNGWEQFGAGDPVGYMKDDMGFVHLRGAITGGAYPSICFNLPLGYRPSNVNTRVPAVGSAYSRCTIGDGVQTSAGSGWISLDGITFRAEVRK